jgi:hypothetical protein
MKSKILIVAIAIFTMLFVNNLYSQVKIGEITSSGATITHDLNDLLQALEKEYESNTPITLVTAKIHITNDNVYYLIGCASGDKDKISVKLEKDPANNNLYICRGAGVEKQWCADCDNPDCTLNYNGKGEPVGCKDASCPYPNEFCNHHISTGPGIIFVERYLQKKK